MTTLHDLVVPQLGEEVTAVTLVAWWAEPGGRVTAGEPLFEVETDKAVFEVEAEVSGTLVEVRVPVGGAAAPGAVVGRVEAG